MVEINKKVPSFLFRLTSNVIYFISTIKKRLYNITTGVGTYLRLTEIQ